MSVEWCNDLDMVVLEVPQEGSKATSDAERSTWRKLLLELESEAEVVDCTSENLTKEARASHDKSKESDGVVKCCQTSSCTTQPMSDG